MMIFSETTAVVFTVILLIGVGWRLALVVTRLRRQQRRARDEDHDDDR